MIIQIIAATEPSSPSSLTRSDEMTNTTQVSFSWTAPQQDGGENVKDYTVEMKQT